MLELLLDLENHLRDKAARNGQDVTDYLRQIAGLPGELAGNADRPRESDPAYLLSLPKAARDHIMEAQAALAAPLYEADLALPIAERELTAFYDRAKWESIFPLKIIMNWSTEAMAALQEGRTVEVKPRGHSMTGRINDGDLVTLEPCRSEELTVGAFVLVRIRGKRFSHVVLHGILSVEGERFLIGSHQGRVDGWVDRDDIYGIATKVKA